MTPVLDWTAFGGVLFDLDGVLTPTALVHEAAWATMFDEFLDDRGEELGADSLEPFSAADYLRWVDGKPRYDGVRSFLGSRGITLPEGSADDPAGHGTVCALGNRKNELFGHIIATKGVNPYPGSVELLNRLDELGVPQAVVSSSKNAGDVLVAAGLADRFDVVVDGVVAAAAGLAGKPAPDAFLLGATRLDVDPATAVVVEDAVSGVQAGRAGGFALVVGVDRGGNGDLVPAGADLVVADLAELVGRP